MSFFSSSPSAGYRSPAACRRFGATAFTLAELLVTMAVGTILIIFLFQLFSSSMRAWRQGEDQVETFREARAALQLMVRDLSQTVAPMTGSMYASPTPTPGANLAVVAPVLVLDYFNGQKPANGGDINDEVYCQTTIPNDGASQLCAVGYFCAWKPDISTDSTRAPRAFSLLRQFLGSGAPAAGSTPAVPGLYDRFQAASGSNPLNFLQVFDHVLPPQVSAGTPPKANATELAAYIWDLQIRLPDAWQGSASRYLAAGPPATRLPPYLEVRFKALSESAARRLEGNAAVTADTWKDTNVSSPIYKSIILPGTRQFSARVPIHSDSGSATTTPSPTP